MTTGTAAILLNPSVAATFKQSYLQQIEHAVRFVSCDFRDPWPTSMDAYSTRSVLQKGSFGSIKHVLATGNGFRKTDRQEGRSCIIKTTYLHELFDRVIQEARAAKKPSLLKIKSPEVRLQRIIRRIVMELFVTTRCRHENILHLHAVFISQEGLHAAMPCFHVLKNMIEAYRELHNFEPIPMTIIAPIVRQLCKALDYLHSIGIVHRDVQSEHILLTRNATVKLCHFGQAKALVTEQMKAACRTPVGKEEFMSSEKLFNLHKAQSLDDCRSYGTDADIWSVGVLILNMISYFPNEKFQKLPKDFALVLDQEQMPFTWLTSDMVQLRARLLKSGGADLNRFLNDHIFTTNPDKRMTARQILESRRFLCWCSRSIAEDKKFIRKKFIGEIDFSNRQKLAVEGSNFDTLESKNIPAEFYWSDAWKIIEETKFVFGMSSVNSAQHFVQKCFQFSEPEPLFATIYRQLESGIIGLSDVIAIHHEAHKMAFELVAALQHQQESKQKQSVGKGSLSYEYQPCQGFSPVKSAPVLLEMSLFSPDPQRLSSGSNDLCCSTSFNTTY